MAIARGGGGLGVAAGTGVGSKVVPPFESPLAVSASPTGLASVARSGCSAPAVAAAMLASTICCPRAAAVNRSISGLNATHVAVASAGEKVAVGSTTAFSALDPVHDTIAMAPITPSTSTSNCGRIESNGYRFRSKYFLERCTCVTTWRHYIRVYPRVHRSARTLTRGCGQAFFDSKSSEMSIARGEWVSAPTEIISTPLSATSATFSSVIPPDASTVDPAPI